MAVVQPLQHAASPTSVQHFVSANFDSFIPGNSGMGNVKREPGNGNLCLPPSEWYNPNSTTFPLSKVVNSDGSIAIILAPVMKIS